MTRDEIIITIENIKRHHEANLFYPALSKDYCKFAEDNYNEAIRVLKTYPILTDTEIKIVDRAICSMEDYCSSCESYLNLFPNEVEINEKFKHVIESLSPLINSLNTEFNRK